MDRKSAIMLYPLNLDVRENPHSGGAALFFQHGDNLLRGAVTEKLSQSFFVICDSVFFHQGNEVSGRVAGQRRFGKVRVGGEKIFRTAMNIGEVAASAAGDQYLFADALRALQHGHAPSAFAGF